jgi:glycosyltransferase involved in cell wall biosynthesis
LKIIQVIHGYPIRYNAGSEIYTQTLSRVLAERGNSVNVFSRTEDPFRPDYEFTSESDHEGPPIELNLVNMPSSRDRYRHESVDNQFGALLDRINPDIVHIQHLNHLSTSLVNEVAKRNIPIVFTLHDYWIMCPRGQFVQFGMNGTEAWKLCDGQDDYKCAVSCYSRYFTGDESFVSEDVHYWTDWIHERMSHVRKITGFVDLFVAPSEYLLRRFRDEFQIPASKLVYLDYGFDVARLSERKRTEERDFVFGYIGTHTAQKGIHLLIDAFEKIQGNARLRIWGRTNGQVTAALKERSSLLLPDCSKRIEWLPEYRNTEIVERVLNRIDVLVVPSIWIENSPLVIHEAQQARIPVITANMGGMAEYVRHKENGLLFKPRDSDDLARQMQLLLDNPVLATGLGKRGYIKSKTGDVPSIEEHVSVLENIYRSLLRERETQVITTKP